MRGIQKACALLAAGLVLAGCAAGDGTPASSTTGPGPATAPAPSASRTVTVGPTEEPTATDVACEPFGSTDPASSADPLALSTLTGSAMRVGRHDCFERLVLEMVGTGPEPGWRVSYADPLLGQASGLPVDLLGEAALDIIVGVWTVTDFEGRPAEWPPFTGPDDIVTTGYTALREARMLYAYEGTTQVGLGLDQARPFRVSLLADPARLVVDVYTGQPLG